MVVKLAADEDDYNNVDNDDADADTDDDDDDDDDDEDEDDYNDVDKDDDDGDEQGDAYNKTWGKKKGQFPIFSLLSFVIIPVFVSFLAFGKFLGQVRRKADLTFFLFVNWRRTNDSCLSLRLKFKNATFSWKSLA